MAKDMHENLSDIPLRQSQIIMSSSVGGMLVSLLMTPVDVVKVRMQAQLRPIVPGHCFLYCNGLMDHLCPCVNGNGIGVSTVGEDAVYQIARREGVLSLWSGLSPTLIMALPQTVIYYSLNEFILNYVGYKAGSTDSHIWIPGVVGGLSRVITVFVIQPLELIRIKKQSEKLPFSKIKQLLQISVKEGGIRSLWVGMGPSLLRDIPFSMIFWFLFQNLKSNHLKMQTGPTNELDLEYAICFGAISGTVAGIITLPFDVVKTHRQIELGEVTFFNRPLQSTLSSLRDLYVKQGFRSLFAGFTPRVLKVAPACAVMIGAFEYLKAYFRNQNRLQEVGQSH